MQWLAIHFPLLPLEIFTRGQVLDGPLAVASAGRLPRILLCNHVAAKQGISAPMPQAAARALDSRLRILRRDEASETRTLKNLAAWAGRFSSLVSLEPPQTLLLEVSGSLRLFHGLRPLLRQVESELEKLAYRTCLAVTPTPAASALLARTGQACVLPDDGALRGALASLPVTSLNLAETQRSMLRTMGVRRLGELLRLPRGGMARRLGRGFVDDLDRMLGRLPDPRPPFVPPERFSSRLVLPVETRDSRALQFACRRLLGELDGYLLARQAGIQQLMWRLYHGDSPPTRFALGLADPSRDSSRFMDLLRQRLERLCLPAPVREIALVAKEPRPLAAQDGELFPDPAYHRDGDAHRLIERLQARLGHDQVRGIRPLPEYRPEQAWEYCEPGQARAQETRLPERPFWLLPAPEPLQQVQGRPWRGGPLVLEPERERIESGWWDGRDVRRDYFVARAPDGMRLWVFRERDGERGWYLHGVFG